MSFYFSTKMMVMNRNKRHFLTFCGELVTSQEITKKIIIGNFRYLLTAKDIYNQFSKNNNQILNMIINYLLKKLTNNDFFYSFSYFF